MLNVLRSVHLYMTGQSFAVFFYYVFSLCARDNDFATLHFANG